jgi:hypothetical protein
VRIRSYQFLAPLPGIVFQTVVYEVFRVTFSLIFVHIVYSVDSVFLYKIRLCPKLVFSVFCFWFLLCICLFCFCRIGQGSIVTPLGSIVTLLSSSTEATAARQKLIFFFIFFFFYYSALIVCIYIILFKWCTGFCFKRKKKFFFKVVLHLLLPFLFLQKCTRDRS